MATCNACPRARTKNCLNCAHRERTDWRELQGQDLQVLERVKVRQAFRPGEAIFVQGGPCQGLHIIETGTVALRKTDPQGNAVITRLIHPGGSLGYRTFFAGGSYSSTAEALTPVQVCLIPGDGVRELLDRNPAILRRFLTILARDLREAEEDRLERTALPLRARLAHLLLALADRYADQTDDGGFVMRLPLARQDMAAVLGVRPESLARAIRALEQDGVVWLRGRTVGLPDVDLLIGESEQAS